MRYPVLGMLLFVLFVEMASAYETAVREAQSELAEGEASAALERLQAEELEHSGEPTFDYWLGVAALRAGQPTYALLALDRVLYQQPNHAGARLERVAALLQLDQRDAAARELERLRDLSPPEEAEAAMARYQAAIDRRQRRETQPTHDARLGLDFGYDGNPQRYANEVALDPLDPELRQTVNELANTGLIGEDALSEYEKQVFDPKGSAYRRLRARYQGIFPHDEQTRFRLTGVAQSQQYVTSAAEDYDLTIGQVQAGLERDLAPERVLTLSTTAMRAWQGRGLDNLLSRWGGEATLRHPIGLDDTLTWRLGGSVSRFERQRDDYDAARFGIGWRAQRGDWRTRLGIQIRREWALEDRDGGNLDILRLRAGVDYTLSTRQTLRFSLHQRLGHYDERGFGVYNDYNPIRRRDRTTRAGLTWLYALSRDWLVNVGVQFERRRSNMRFFDTRREQAEIGLRYRF